jgi:hypothetical protein
MSTTPREPPSRYPVQRVATAMESHMPDTDRSNSSRARSIGPIRSIAMILAHGVLRLQQRQKALDTRTEQRVHDPVLNPKGDTA